MADDMATRLAPLQRLQGLEATHLLIHEIYASVQGESTHAGRPCTFIRTTTCNQRCRYCDTAYAFTEGEPMHIDDVVREALVKGTGLVEITGGEPLLQPLFTKLCERLLQAGCEVLVETGGSRDTSCVPAGVKVILDIKTPGSGEEHANDYGNLNRLRAGDEIKFVLTSAQDYGWARDLIRRERLHERATVLLSPAWKLVDPQELVQWMLADNVPARLNLQVHKYIWPPHKRGV
jgi:7-carboxy-7-deazaguanine synthase